MKKYLSHARSSIAVLTVALAASALAVCLPVEAQINQAQISPTETVDLPSAMIVDTSNNRVVVYDSLGAPHVGQFAHIEDFTKSAAYLNYLQYTPTFALNMTQISSVMCVGTTSVVFWHVSGVQNLDDRCALANALIAIARR